MGDSRFRSESHSDAGLGAEVADAAGQSAAVSTEHVLSVGRAAGLTSVGVAAADVLEPARTVLHLRKKRGLAGSMQFTYRNPDRSTSPETTLPGARSLVAGALSYAPWKAPGSPSPDGQSSLPLHGRVARYAWRDHYGALSEALQPIADLLEGAGYRAKIVADSNALVDRNVAWSAGLGWYGKNSNLLLPGSGSWFVLGAVVTDAVLTPTGPPVADGCGSCRQCIDDCPTGAILAPGVVDANRCLAWLVQGPGPIPVEFRPAIGDRLYGCDDCQEVCPPNRAIDRSISHQTIEEADQANVDLVWVLTAGDDEILDRHGRWYIAGRDVDIIRRTALVAIGNVATPPDDQIAALIGRYLRHDEPMLRGHAVWAARRLGCTDQLSAVAADPEVSGDMAAEVEPRFAPEAWR